MTKRLTGQGHTLRNGADQERRKFIGGSSPDRCDSAARKETLAEFCATGSPHIPRMLGRPATRPSPDEVRLVLDEHRREDVGVLRTLQSVIAVPRIRCNPTCCFCS